MAIYLIANGPMQTTAAFAAVTTGTSIKTMLQIKPFNPVKIIEWGISFDGSAAATPIKVELIETGTVFATVTASADADITKYGFVGDATAASVKGLTLGTTATGYTSTSEGSITATRLLAGPQFIAPTSQFIQAFPLGQEPIVQIANSGRIRVTAGAAVNCYCYMKIEM